MLSALTGLKLKEGVQGDLVAMFDPRNRTVALSLLFTKTKKLDFDPEVKIKCEVKINFKSVPLLAFGFSDGFPLGPDQGCVIDLTNLSHSSMDKSFGDDIAAYIDMKRAIDIGITNMVKRNSTVRIDLVNQNEQLANDEDTVFKIRFHVDAGYAGQAKTVCPINHTTSRGVTLRDNVSGMVYSDPLEFFEIPFLEKIINTVPKQVGKQELIK